MPKEQGVFHRLLVKLVPQLSEDWQGKPGKRFRDGMTRISDYMKDVQVGEKVQEAHDLLWQRARGEGHEKLAKAESDYAKAENDRMECELKRRTLDAQVRRVMADSKNAEHEAELMELKVIDARIDLIAKAKENGVSLSIDASNRIVVRPLLTYEATPEPALTPVVEEARQVRGGIVEVPLDRDCGEFHIEWHVRVGDKVEANTEIASASFRPFRVPYGAKVTGSGARIAAPVSGRIVEICFYEGEELRQGDILAKILCSEPGS